MALCDNLLSTNVARNCGNVKGLEKEAVLINRDDIDWAAVIKHETYNNVYTAVPLKEGKTGYKAEQMPKGAFADTNTEMQTKNYNNDFTEKLAFRLLDSGVLAAKAATELANANIVAIVKQKNKSADSSNIQPIYRIYGISGEGLMATALTNDPNDEDGNIWKVEMSSEGSTQAATFLWDTSEAATEAKFKNYIAD